MHGTVTPKIAFALWRHDQFDKYLNDDLSDKDIKRINTSLQLKNNKNIYKNRNMEEIQQINTLNIEKSLIMGLNQFSFEIVQQTEERKRLEMQYESLRQHTSQLADHAINCQVKNLRLDQSLQNATKERENLVRHLNK